MILWDKMARKIVCHGIDMLTVYCSTVYVVLCVSCIYLVYIMVLLVVCTRIKETWHQWNQRRWYKITHNFFHLCMTIISVTVELHNISFYLWKMYLFLHIYVCNYKKTCINSLKLCIFKLYVYMQMFTNFTYIIVHL